MKSLLLVSPKWMGIYQDIIESLKIKGFEVDFINEISNKRDPNNVRGRNPYSLKKYDNKLKRYWLNILNSSSYNKSYDILLVIDGQGLHPILFEILMSRNDKLLKVNYLFDTIAGVYHFENNFKYFDRVFSFDINESRKFGISFMPIYWKPQDYGEIKYKFFGFGSYIKQRFDLFTCLEEFASIYKMNSFIKILIKNRFPNWLYDVRRIIRNMFNLEDDYPNVVYNSSLAYEHPLSPTQFRNLINSSEIIIDTSPLHQDGLTARFMWALGAGKKIITTNASVKIYPFYSDEFIYVVDKIESFVNNKKFCIFVNNRYVECNKTRLLINEYRIDNWLDVLLGGRI